MSDGSPPPKRGPSLAGNTLRALGARRSGEPAAPTDETPANETPADDTPVEVPGDAPGDTPVEVPGDEPQADDAPGDESSAAVADTTAEDTTAEGTTVEGPGAEEPTVEEPAVEEPTADAPSADEPAAEEPAEGPAVKDATDDPATDTVVPTTPARSRTRAGAPARSAHRQSRTSGDQRATRRTTNVPLVVVSVLTVAALVFAVLAGIGWWHTAHGSTRAGALARDAALLQARLDIEAVNTSDYRHSSQALDSWLAVTTGSLHTQYAQHRSSAVDLLRKAKVSTSATVLAAAVTKVDAGKGTATVLASVDVVKRPASGKPSTARNRFSASMRKVHGQWKLADLSLVPVQLQ